MKYTRKKSGGKYKVRSQLQDEMTMYDLTKKDSLIGLLGTWVEKILGH